MKRIIGFVLITWLLAVCASCNLMPESASYQSFNKNVTMPDLPNFVAAWTYCANVRYVSDMDSHGVTDYWQGPNETVYRQTGDCEDYVILLSYYAQKFGMNPRLVVVRLPNGVYHALMSAGGLWYDAEVSGLTVIPGAYPVSRDISYAQALSDVHSIYGSN